MIDKIQGAAQGITVNHARNKKRTSLLTSANEKSVTVVSAISTPRIAQAAAAPTITLTSRACLLNV